MKRESSEYNNYKSFFQAFPGLYNENLKQLNYLYKYKSIPFSIFETGYKK